MIKAERAAESLWWILWIFSFHHRILLYDIIFLLWCDDDVVSKASVRLPRAIVRQRTLNNFARSEVLFVAPASRRRNGSFRCEPIRMHRQENYSFGGRERPKRPRNSRSKRHTNTFFRRLRAKRVALFVFIFHFFLFQQKETHHLLRPKVSGTP